MGRCLLISAFIGETVPLLLLYIERYSEPLIFFWISHILWPSSLLLMATGGGDEVADDQQRAVAILLNALLYAFIGLVIWLLFLRGRESTK